MRLPRAWPCILLMACALPPSHVEPAPYQVLVKSVRLPDRDWLPWIARFAEHCWVEVITPEQSLRIEWNSWLDAIARSPLDAGDVLRDQRWDRDVAVHAHWSGDDARALGERILAVASDYPDAADYRAWPGPNSNTFVAWLAREADLHVALPPNAVGKDYTPWLAAGLSTTGLGVHLDTVVLGAQLGLVEGVELHLLGLTAGVALWPPALKLPFVPAIPGGWLY